MDLIRMLKLHSSLWLPSITKFHLHLFLMDTLIKTLLIVKYGVISLTIPNKHEMSKVQSISNNQYVLIAQCIPQLQLQILDHGGIFISLQITAGEDYMAGFSQTIMDGDDEYCRTLFSKNTTDNTENYLSYYY